MSYLNNTPDPHTENAPEAAEDIPHVANVCNEDKEKVECGSVRSSPGSNLGEEKKMEEQARAKTERYLLPEGSTSMLHVLVRTVNESTMVERKHFYNGLGEILDVAKKTWP